MRFSATLVATGGKTTGIPVPDDLVTELGGGRRPAVSVTAAGHTWRTSIASMSGQFWIGVSADIRTITGLTAGDAIDVEVELDTAPREVTVPDDLAAALDAEDTAKAAFEALAYSHKRRHVMSIEDAKTPETRARRIAKAVETLRDGR